MSDEKPMPKRNEPPSPAHLEEAREIDLRARQRRAAEAVADYEREQREADRDD